MTSVRPGIARRLFSEQHDSALGRWSFTGLIPHPALTGLVNLGWHARGWTSYTRERILPMGDVVLLFNMDGNQGLVDRDDPDLVTPYTEAWISGLQQTFVIVESHQTHMMGLRMTPWGVFRLFGLPLTEVVDQVIELEALFGSDMTKLLERLRNEVGVVARLQLLEGDLLARLGKGKAPAAEAVATLRALIRSRGQASLQGIARQLGVTPKRIAQRFATCVGVTPKRYARLLRYQHALSRLASGEADLGVVAIECGYYDQAHFNREFRGFTGATPSQYLCRKGPDGTSILD